MTYEIVTPYLKGFHLTLAAHHPKRNSEGWKLSPREWDAYVWGKASKGKFSTDEAETFSDVGHDTPPPEDEYSRTSQPTTYPDPVEPPLLVRTFACLKFDLEALDALFNEDTPTEVLLRAAHLEKTVLLTNLGSQTSMMTPPIFENSKTSFVLRKTKLVKETWITQLCSYAQTIQQSKQD
jgi:hypothetical protein